MEAVRTGPFSTVSLSLSLLQRPRFPSSWLRLVVAVANFFFSFFFIVGAKRGRVFSCVCTPRVFQRRVAFECVCVVTRYVGHTSSFDFTAWFLKWIGFVPATKLVHGNGNVGVARWIPVEGQLLISCYECNRRNNCHLLWKQVVCIYGSSFVYFIKNCDFVVYYY